MRRREARRERLAGCWPALAGLQARGSPGCWPAPDRSPGEARGSPVGSLAGCWPDKSRGSPGCWPAPDRSPALACAGLLSPVKLLACARLRSPGEARRLLACARRVAVAGRGSPVGLLACAGAGVTPGSSRTTRSIGTISKIGVIVTTGKSRTRPDTRLNRA